MKKINFNLKDRKTLSLVLCLVLVCVFTLTVAYSALSAVLTISGNARVSAADWDIYLNNPRVTSGSATTNVPEIKTSSTLEFETTLNMPGDFYEFVVDVVNGGDIDAMIENVVKNPELTAEQAKYLNYIIEYQNGESINTKQLVSKNSFVRLKVRVEFRKDITASDLPATSETLNLAFTVNYVQSDGSGSSVNNNGVSVVSADGDINAIGTIVTIGTEQFYTIGTEGEDVKLLAMYNLYVGKECTSYTSSSCTTYGDEATGMQDSTMLGLLNFETLNKGVTEFSSNEQKGTNYNDYNGSIVEGYVNNYKTMIESRFGVIVEEARLITKDELTNPDTFACSETEWSCSSSSYEWIYSTSYWSGSGVEDIYIYYVVRNGNFGGENYATSVGLGVRPVIVISKDLIDNVSSTSKKIVEFSVDGVVYQAEEGMTWGEWVDSKYNVDNFYFNDMGYISGDYELDFCETKDDIILLRDYSYNDTYGVGCLPPLN